MTTAMSTKAAGASQAGDSPRLMNPAATWVKRGVPLDGRPAQVRMQKIGEAIARGQVIAREAGHHFAPLVRGMEGVEPDLRGFAYEGVGMVLTLADLLGDQRILAGSKRLPTLRAHQLAQSNETWRKWILVGVGLGFAHAVGRHIPPSAPASSGEEAPWTESARSNVELVLDYMLGCGPIDALQIADGLGMALTAAAAETWLEPAASFTVFKNRAWLSTNRGADPDGSLTISAARGFDHGVGRAIWFVNCGEPDAIVRTMAAFVGNPRLGDLWGGVGYAGTYAGGAPETKWRDLVAREPTGRGYISQGVACAASSRLRSTGAYPETEVACRAAWNRSPQETVLAMKEWLKNKNMASPAAAPDGWIHARVALEFQSETH